MNYLKFILLTVISTVTLFAQTNYALTFINSSNSYIVVPYTDTLQPKTALTVEAWLNVNAWSGTPGIVGNTEFGGYELQIEQLGGVYWINFWVKRNGNYALASISQSTFGTGWHHVAGTYDGQFTRIYLDGVLQSSNDAGGTYPIQYSYNNALIIGAEASSGPGPYGFYYNGSMDEVRIWNIARSADSITAAKGRELIGTEPNLIGYWKFNEGSGSIANDASIYHQNGTIGTGPSWILFDEGRNWYNLGTPGISQGISYYLSLAVAANGTPYVGFTDNANGNRATVMKYTGSFWLPLKAYGFTTGTALHLNMTLAQDGTPYVAFQDGSMTNKLTVKKFNGTDWVPVGDSGCSAGSVTDVQIRIASDGTPYVGFADGANSGKPTAMKYNGSSWEIVGTAGFSSTIPSDQDFKLSNDDIPYFALRGGFGVLQQANVVKFNGTAWVSVGPSNFTSNTAYYISLAFSPSNVPYVAFVDSRVKVMKDSSSTWVTVGNMNTSTSPYLPSIAFGQDGTPYVAYSEGGIMAVKKYIGSDWQFVGTAGITTSTIDYPLIAFSSTGVLFEAHTENVLGNKPVVRRYLLDSNTPLPVELTSFRSESHASSVTLRWSTATEMNNYGFEIERKNISPSTAWTTIAFVEGNGTSQAVHEYSYTDRSVSPQRYAYRLKQIDRDGNVAYSPVTEVTVDGTPAAFALLQNYPNPFNPSTTIRFAVNGDARVQAVISVYDLLGRQVAQIYNAPAEPGTIYQVPFTASHLPSGVYLCRLRTEKTELATRLILMK